MILEIEQIVKGLKDIGIECKIIDNETYAYINIPLYKLDYSIKIKDVDFPCVSNIVTALIIEANNIGYYNGEYDVQQNIKRILDI
jgi:hypothetical protein